MTNTRERFDLEVEKWDRIYSGTGPLPVRLWNWAARANVRRRFTRTFELAGDLRGCTVLDLGSGTGRYVLRALELGAKRVVAVDRSTAMAEYVTTLGGRLGFEDRVEVKKADLLDLDCTEQFDLVIMNGVLDYMSDPAAALSQAWRLCRGVLVATAPDKRALRAPIRRAYWKLRGLPTFYFGASDLAELADQRGLRPFTIERIGPIYLLGARASRPA